MTEQDAIEFGKRVIDLGLKDDTHAFCEMAISALEKRIPKKPKQITLRHGIITTNYECPDCGCRRLGHGFNLDKCFCPECGQKLDWGDKNAM